MNFDRDTLELIRLMDMSEKGIAQLRHYDRVEELTGTLLGELRRNSAFEFRFRFSYDDAGEVLEVDHELSHEVSVNNHLILGVSNEVWGKRWAHDPSYPGRLECISSNDRIPGVDIQEMAQTAFGIVLRRYQTDPNRAAIAAALGYDDIAVIEDARSFDAAVAAKQDAFLSAALHLSEAGTLYESVHRLGNLIETLESANRPSRRP